MSVYDSRSINSQSRSEVQREGRLGVDENLEQSSNGVKDIQE